MHAFFPRRFPYGFCRRLRTNLSLESGDGGIHKRQRQCGKYYILDGKRQGEAEQTRFPADVTQEFGNRKPT
jgi:hypothetical protein